MSHLTAAASRAPARPGVLAFALLAGAACGPGDPGTAETLARYFDAVQARDLDTLYCLSAGAATAEEQPAGSGSRRERFAAWAAGQYERYVEGREAGFVDLEGDALLAAKTFSLGHGTFYAVADRGEIAPGARRLDTTLRFGYAQVDLSRFPPGTVLYLNGAPPGAVRSLRVPAGAAEIEVEALDRLALRWTLVRSPAADGCPAGWTVAAAEPVEESAGTIDLRLVF